MHVAAFFCLRPYLNKYAGLTKTDQDKMMEDLISERTDYTGIRGTLTLDQLDSLWKADFPLEANWRTYQHPQNNWPEGKFQSMAEETNSIIYLCNSILQLVNRGENVL